MPLSNSDSQNGTFIGDKRDWLKVNGVDETTDQSDYDIDDESFGLPLKTRHLDSNFGEILQSTESKKVRFAEGNERMTVEELLENTSNLNLYVENNINRIGDFRSGSEIQEWYRSVTPETPSGISTKATVTTTVYSGGSTSNFQLSEGDERDMSITGAGSDRDDSVYDHRISSLISGNFRNCSQDNYSSPKSSILDTIEDHRDNTLLNHLFPKNSENVEKFDPKLSSAQVLKIFNDYINLCLELSSGMQAEPEDAVQAVQAVQAAQAVHEDASEEGKNVFHMKSTPTLSVSDYIDRIESKCCFPPIIYLTACFLLLTYCDLKYDEDTSRFSVSNQIDKFMAHRLIIALIRVSAKLLEDHVHSHSYFSKVCGVSKKLLTKIELSLILLLQNTANGLIITEFSIQTVLSLHALMS